MTFARNPISKITIKRICLLLVALFFLFGLNACPELGSRLGAFLPILVVLAAVVSSDATSALPVDTPHFFNINPPVIYEEVMEEGELRVKLPSIPSGTESFAAVMATNASSFVDSLVSQVTTNFDTAVAQEFLTAKEGRIAKKRMGKIAKLLKKDFTKFGNQASRLTVLLAAEEVTEEQVSRAVNRAILRMKKKKSKSFGKPFKGKAPKKAAAAKSRIKVARQNRSVSGLFINFFQSLDTQLQAVATTQDQIDLSAAFLAALQNALEKDIAQNEKAADQAFKNAYKSKGAIKNPSDLAGTYEGTSTYLTGGVRSTIEFDTVVDSANTLSGFGGSISSVFDKGLTLNTTIDSIGTFALVITKGGTIRASLTFPGESAPQVKVRGKIDAKKKILELDILEILDEDDYTGGGIRHRIAVVQNQSGSECNSFAALIGGQAKLSPTGELTFTFEEDILRPTGDVINILSGSKDDTNKSTLAQVSTSSVTFPTDSFTLQLSSEQCTALSDARDFNVGVPQSPVDNTKTGDFTELGNGCNVVC